MSLRHLAARIEQNLLKRIGTITHVVTQAPFVALTFDDGPHPEYTPRLLDILERHQARATFFVIGQHAQRYPQIIQRMAQAGHAICNHSWNHPRLSLLNCRDRHYQLQACTRATAPYGHKILRPPYGAQTRTSLLHGLLLGYRVVTWSIVADDWIAHDAEWIAARLMSQLEAGSIVLLHDKLWLPTDEHATNRGSSPHSVMSLSMLEANCDEQASDRGPVIEAVDVVLTQSQNMFHFVTVPELLKSGRPVRKKWQYL